MTCVFMQRMNANRRTIAFRHFSSRFIELFVISRCIGYCFVCNMTQPSDIGIVSCFCNDQHFREVFIYDSLPAVEVRS